MASTKTPPRQVVSEGSYKAALYSLILPGTGQMKLGRRREAVLSICLSAPFLAAGSILAYAVYQESHLATYILIGIALLPNYLSAISAARPVYAPVPAAPAAQLVPCTACGTELSVAASACPKCGHPVARQQAASSSLGRIVLVASILGGIWWVWGGGYKWYLNDISRDVAADAVAQYRMVEKTGSKMDKCVQAGLVAAAYLQAQDQWNYENWHLIERGDCLAAGVPR